MYYQTEPAHVSLLRPIKVPEIFVIGDKFIKWEEQTSRPTKFTSQKKGGEDSESIARFAVNLKIDKDGFFLHWTDKNNEVEVLDFAMIRDARTGRHAKIPKDAKFKAAMTANCSEPLENRTITVCFGPDFVNLSFINFCCFRSDIARMWSNEILRIAYNLNQLHMPPLRFLRKAHTRIMLMAEKHQKIPVAKIVKMFAQHRDDRKKVEKALEAAGLTSTKGDYVSKSKITFNDFFNFYKHLTSRTEVEKIFDSLCPSSKKRVLTADKFADFLNKTQRDPRLNEILYPYLNASKAGELIKKYEPNRSNAQKRHLSVDGFLKYLLSADNPIVAHSAFQLSHDMDQPLSHYFINSSHNTYLTGHQLTGKSSVEIYRQCLLSGCRCVELDFWNGRIDEPVIVHGFTFVPEVSAKEVMEAIAETAFTTSDFPVILSFENHCNPKQQAKIAQYCRQIFGNMLLDSPLETHPLEPGSVLPSPADLRYKIIIKNKKKLFHPETIGEDADSPEPEPGVSGIKDMVSELFKKNKDPTTEKLETLSYLSTSSEDIPSDDDDDMDDEDESSSAEEEDDVVGVRGVLSEKTTEKPSKKETEAGAEISALVNYIQPVHFTSFEVAEKNKKFYEMSSFDEKQALTLLKEHPAEFVNYNKVQLSRIYPSGKRFDSSNFMPQVFWNAGCQLVALNFQTLDIAMQLNLGMFEYNARCGYLLKPEFMRRDDRRLDPFAESTLDGIIAGTVSIQVLSAQFLSDKRIGTYIEVEMYGLPTDTVRRKFRTKTVHNNGINPQYNEEPFIFKKVVLPELACVRIAAYEESGRFIGHRVLPVTAMCPGYRHVSLRCDAGQACYITTVFVFGVVKDYVPDGLSNIAEALTNPIKYQSDLDKRAEQLSVLTEGCDVDIEHFYLEDGAASTSKYPLGSHLGRPQLPRSHLPTSQLPTSTSQLPTSQLPTSHLPRSHLQQPYPDYGAALALPSTSSAPPIFRPPRVVMVPHQGESSARIESVFAADAAEALMQPGTSNPYTITSLSQPLAVETVDVLMEYKVIQEKKQELEDKLDVERKKYEKERDKLLSVEYERSKIGYYATRMIRVISGRNKELAARDYCDNSRRGRTVSQNQKEKLIAAYTKYAAQEIQLKEKYDEQIFNQIEKLMTISQTNQLKMLKTLLAKETSAVMKEVQTTRREEVKKLSEIHKDKDELVRMKREVASAMINKGVNERVRLRDLYRSKVDDLKKRHEEARKDLEDERMKAKIGTMRQHECMLSKALEELPSSSRRNFKI